MPKATRKSLPSVASPARSSPRASTKASTAAAGTTSPAKSAGRHGKVQGETETGGRTGSRNAGKVQTPSPATGRGGSRTRGKGDTPTAAVSKTPPSAGRSRRGKPEKEETDELEEKGQAATSTSGRRGRGSTKKDEEPSKEAEAKKTPAAGSRRSRSKAGREEDAEGDGKKSEEAGKAEVKSSPAEGRRNIGRAEKEEKEKGQAIIEEAKKTPPAPARRGRGSPSKKGEDRKEEQPEEMSEKDTKKTPTVSGRHGRNQGRSEAEQQKEETAEEKMEKEVNKTPVSARRGRGRLGKEEEEAESKSDKDQTEKMSPSPSKRGRGKNKTFEEAEEKEKELKSPTSSRRGGKGKEKQEEPEEKKIEEAAEAEDKMEVDEERKDKEETTPKKGRGRGGQITAEAAEIKSTPPKAARSSRRSAGLLDTEGGQAEESSSPPVRGRNKGKSDQVKPAVVDSDSAGGGDRVANAEDKKEAEAEKVTETVGNQEDLKPTKETDSKTEEKEEDMAEKEAGPAGEEGTKPPTEEDEMETEAQETAKDFNATKTEESPCDKIEATETVQSLDNNLSREPAQEEITPMEQDLLSEAEPKNGKTEVSGDRNKISGKRKIEEVPIQDESVSATAKKARLNGTEPSSVDTAKPDPASAEEEMNDAEVLKGFVVVNKEELPAPDSEEVAAAVPQTAEETHSSSSEESMETDKIVLPCFVEPAVVPLTEAEVAKAYASEIQGSKKEESDDISSVIVEVGSVAGSDIVSNLAARGLDTSELQSASNSIDGEEVADASINESAFAVPDSEFISSEMPQEVAAIDTDEVPVSEKASSTSVQSGSKVLVSKGSSSVSLSLGTPDPTFLATYSSPDIFTRAYVPNPAVSPESNVVTNDFSVVSYNILAECHRLNSDYSYTPVEYLGLEYRHVLLMRELEYLNGDIVCLQEVSPAYFSSTLQPKMKSLGYEGLMQCRTKGVDEGEATFYKCDHFVLEASKEVSLGEAAQKEVEAGGLTPEVFEAVKKYLDRADVVLITKLRCKNSGKVITVGNVHIVWDNLQSPDVQCIQAACAIKEIVTVAGGDGAHIICGDFNSEWSSPIYQLVVDGYLSDSSIHILQAVQRLELEDGAKSLVNHLWGAFQHTSSNLRSAYSTVTKSEPEVTTFTSSMKKAVDYIFYSAGSLIPVGVLKTIDRAVIDASDGLPNKHIPSDHLSLKAIMAFSK